MSTLDNVSSSIGDTKQLTQPVEELASDSVIDTSNHLLKRYDFTASYIVSRYGNKVLSASVESIQGLNYIILYPDESYLTNTDTSIRHIINNHVYLGGLTLICLNDVNSIMVDPGVYLDTNKTIQSPLFDMLFSVDLSTCSQDLVALNQCIVSLQNIPMQTESVHILNIIKDMNALIERLSSDFPAKDFSMHALIK